MTPLEKMLRKMEGDGVCIGNLTYSCVACKRVIARGQEHELWCPLAQAIAAAEKDTSPEPGGQHPAMVWPELIREEIAKTGHLLMGRVQGEGLAWSYEQLVKANADLTASEERVAGMEGLLLDATKVHIPIAQFQDCVGTIRYFANHTDIETCIALEEWMDELEQALTPNETQDKE